jgi:succinyl-diaminopimelate desuccinylase
MINKERLVRLTQKLIAIDSQNPPGNEARIGSFVQGYLKKLGVKAKSYSFKKERPNIVAVLKGRNKNPSLLITPHLDTVPAGKNWSLPPFAGKIRKGRLYGLGATDCKGNLACALEVINSLVEDKVKLDYDLIFAATADEEAGSHLGLIPLLKQGILKPKVAIVLDSDDFSIIVAQKGLVHLKIKIQGKRAHGAYPWRGENAIDCAVDIINALRKLKISRHKHLYLRPATMNIGTIRGGDKVNVVADWCEMELDFRFLPQESAQGLLQIIKNIARKYAPKHKIEMESIQKPYEISSSHLLVRHLASAIRKAGERPEIKGSEGATVITFFQNYNIPALATGFGCGGCAHTVN